VLRCELNTLGYPDAALFGFCMAVVMYNALSTVIAALRVTHPEVEAAASQETTIARAPCHPRIHRPIFGAGLA